MHYGSIDAHERYFTVAVVDKNGEIVHEVVGDGEALLEALEGYRPLEMVDRSGRGFTTRWSRPK